MLIYFSDRHELNRPKNPLAKILYPLGDALSWLIRFLALQHNKDVSHWHPKMVRMTNLWKKESLFVSHYSHDKGGSILLIWNYANSEDFIFWFDSFKVWKYLASCFKNIVLVNSDESNLCYKFILIFKGRDCQNMLYSKLLPICGTWLYNWCTRVAKLWEFGCLLTVTLQAWVPKGWVAQNWRTALVAVSFEW